MGQVPSWVGSAARPPRAVIRAAVADVRRRLRRRGRAAFFRAFRLTGAAVASYAVGHALSPNSVPILAPLTALLVVQVTLSGTLHSGLERVVSVVAGVLLAVIFSAGAGLTWWSLGALVAVSIVIGQLLKLGPNLIEVPISAMLVLAVGSGAAGDVALGRISETVVGAIVGVAVNLVFPPALRGLDAGAQVERFAVRIARLLSGAATQLERGPVRDHVHRWMDDARRLSRHVPGVDAKVTEADESRQLNIRALGTLPTSSSLRDGFEALEHSLVSVRSMFRSIQDGVWATEETEDEYGPEVRMAFAVLLKDLARTVRAFGRMVRAQVEADAPAESRQLESALYGLREARARVTDLLLLGPRDDPQHWELNVAVLTTVERLLRELDVEEYLRRRRRAIEEHPLVPGHHTAQRIRSLPRPPLPPVPLPRGHGRHRSIR